MGVKRWAFDLELDQPNERIEETNRDNKRQGIKEIWPLDSQVNKAVIIEIGAVVFDSKTGKILDRFEGFVNNNIQLSSFIKNLTHITQEQVDGGKPLVVVMAELDAWLKSHNVFRQPVVWGIDAEVLRVECKENKIHWNYGKAYYNTKSLYQSYRLTNNKKHHGGLFAALSVMSMEFVGTPHRAVSDAENTALIYHKLTRKFIHRPQVEVNQFGPFSITYSLRIHALRRYIYIYGATNPDDFEKWLLAELINQGIMNLDNETKALSSKEEAQETNRLWYPNNEFGGN